MDKAKSSPTPTPSLLHNIQYIYSNSKENKKSKCMHTYMHIKQSCTTSNQQALYNIYLINAISIKKCFDNMLTKINGM